MVGPGAIGKPVLLLALLALLTWLLLRGIDTDAPQYAATLRALDDFALADASLNRDVLQARAGLLHDYDSLVQAIAAMEKAVARLRSRAKADGLDARPIDRLAAAVERQEGLTERFKSNNALLQNSLSYVGLLSTGPVFGAEHAQLAPETGALAAAILQLARDASPASAKALQERIDRLAARVPRSGSEVQAAEALLAHARLLHDLLPEVNETLRGLVALPSRQPLEAIRAMFSEHQMAVETRAWRVRLLLYVVSLLLLVVLIRLGLRLRERALLLRRRAAFEHVIATNSTRLINCPPAETDERLKQVLGDIGSAIGVDRAYVVLAETPVRVHAWCADGAPYPPGWPDAALALSEQVGEVGFDIIAVRDVEAMPVGDAKRRLLAAGVRSWACVSLMRPGRVRGIMAFDKFQTARGMVFPLPVVRLAGDVVANAIEREFLERERGRLTARLERARRMQMIGSLASGIAHNFNNIIGAILGYSEMIEPQLTPGSRSAQHIAEIRQAAERGRDLIDQVLSFGRRQDTRVRPVQMRSLLDESAALLRVSLPPHVELIVDDIAFDLAVRGEPAQLQQVVLNLCTNAVQAIDDAGSVHVTVERKKVPGRQLLSHGELAPGRYVRLAVTDTGRGFDERVRRRLFEPFFTTRLAGTGLGLATVQEIVRDHDGAMNIQSKPGQGSRFEVWLPAAANTTEGLGDSMLPRGRGETVLVFDAESERLMQDEEMLAALGYEPVGFADPTDAIAACRAAPDRFDAMVVSHTGSAPDGLQLARALHQIARRRPILLATPSAVDVSVDALEQAGVSELLYRPLAGGEIGPALARCLQLVGVLQT
jgi:signal transduction histidine kinase